MNFIITIMSLSSLQPILSITHPPLPPPRRSRDGIQRPPRPVTLHLYQIDKMDGHSFHLIAGDNLTIATTGEIHTILDTCAAPTLGEAETQLQARNPEIKIINAGGTK